MPIIETPKAARLAKTIGCPSTAPVITETTPVPPPPPGLLEDRLALTCEASRLYPWGGFSGDGALLARLPPAPRTEVLADVFPPWRITRTPPMFLAGADREIQAALGARFRSLDGAFPVGPATVLCESRDIHVGGGTLYVVEAGIPHVLYESYRPQERAMLAGPGADFASGEEVVAADGRFLMLDSVGSFNYGHFLVDDLPRLVALDHLPEDGRPLTILMNAYNVLIDETRRRAVGMMVQGRRRIDIRFLDRSKRYRFERLLHVTPVSQQPILKSPAALRAVSARLRRQTRGSRLRATAERFVSGRWRAPRLFVDRAPVRGRELVNRDAVLALVRKRGYEVFDPETTHVGQQIIRFAQAGLVAGIVGAAMTNTLFCRPGTPLLYLTPEGWDDPFFWDLAAARRHPYAELSGPRLDAEARESLRPFRIDLDALDAALERIEGGRAIP